MRARPDDAGPNEPDFPTCCPNCGDENLGIDDEVLDESYLSCGKEQCVEALKRLESEDRAADDAQAAAWRAESLARTAPVCPGCGCRGDDCACINGPGTGTP